MTLYLLCAQADALRLPGDLDTLRAICDGCLWIYSRDTERATLAALAAWPDGFHVGRPYPSPWDGAQLDGYRAVVLGNEPNAPDEADRDPVAESYAAKVQARHEAIRRRYPTLPTIAPALSPGVPGWEDYLARLVAAGAYGRVSAAGAHRYAGADTVRTYRAHLPAGVPVWVTEQGATAPGDPLWQTGDVPVICLFAARWQGHAADGYDLLDRADVLARLRALRGSAPQSRQDAPQGPARALMVGKDKPPVTDYAKATWVPSPNCWGGRQGQKVTAIVLHGTAGPGAVSWFQNPASQVSAHYVVEEDGRVVQCVAEDDAAWHAGVVTPDSAYAGAPNGNLWTIGVEHSRDATNTSPITDAQLAASLDLVKDICRRRGRLALLLHNQFETTRYCPGVPFPRQAFEDALNGQQTAPTEARALDHYGQRGFTVDRRHALWTCCLLPLYRFWRDLAAKGDPLADLLAPGPLAGPEQGYRWGGTRPAGIVRLTNRTVGVYLDEAGTWRPFAVEQ